jgi:hypothetical protein
MMTTLLIAYSKDEDVSLETNINASAPITVLNCTLATFTATTAYTIFTRTTSVSHSGGNGASYAIESAIAFSGVTELTTTHCVWSTTVLKNTHRKRF